MVTIIKRGSSLKTIVAQVKKASTKKVAKKELDAHKYCGAVKFKEDGLTLQKRWRDEWE